MKMQESVTDNKVGGKTPEEIKKGLECQIKIGKCLLLCYFCDLNHPSYFSREVCSDALTYIQRLETNYSQVSKALCGNENATTEELLKAVDQLKTSLAQAERERDAALNDLCTICATCKHNDYSSSKCKIGLYHHGGCNQYCDSWQWRGVCEENTKEDKDHAD